MVGCIYQVEERDASTLFQKSVNLHSSGFTGRFFCGFWFFAYLDDPFLLIILSVLYESTCSDLMLFSFVPVWFERNNEIIMLRFFCAIASYHSPRFWFVTRTWCFLGFGYACLNRFMLRCPISCGISSRQGICGVSPQVEALSWAVSRLNAPLSLLDVFPWTWTDIELE